MNNCSIPRTDGVLIMARGDSRRMGHPKGLIKLPGAKQTFLEMIISVYQDLGWPLTMTIKPEDQFVYSSLLTSFPALNVIHEPGGQDTAQTVLATWMKMSIKPTHLWLHPIDLPLLNQHTIKLLQVESRSNPTDLIRPVFQNKPGHPVIMPASILNILAQKNSGPPWPSGPVRSIVQEAVLKNLVKPMREFEVADNGVTMDFDTISDVENNSPKSPQEGN